VQLSGISSLTSSWDWSYTGDSIVADVSYDLFTNSVASTTSEEYEIMIWLGRLGGAGPIASSYDASGNPVSVASTTVAGYTFDLYKGTNGIQTATYSFVATENITSFSGDINDFLTYLVDSQSFDSSQYLVSIGAGTEAFTGSNAVFTTSSYSISIDTGSGSSSAVASSAVVSSAVASSATSAVASSSTAPVAASYQATSSSISSAAVYTAVPSSSTVVAAVSTSVSYPAASSSSAAATSVAAVSTGAIPYPSGSAPAYTGAASATSHHHPFGTGAPGQDCHVEYVYV